MIKKTFLLLASTSLISVSALADDTRTIPQIVISASRSPLPITQVASSMTVITHEEIERKNKPTVTELLRDVPGLNVANNGGAGQTTRFFLRGTNSNHVLVLLDGLALNDPSDPGDAFDFSNLATDNIERIEILRGAQSTLYGSQAIGGVISIISRKGQGAPRVNASTEYGSFNTRRESVGASGEAGRTSYSIQSGNVHTNGISALDKKFGGHEKDGSDGYVFSGNVASRLTDIFTAKLNLRYNRTNTQFDSLGSQIPRPFDDPAPENDSRQFNGRAAGELSLLDGKWTQELGIGYLNLNRAQVTEYYIGFTPAFGRQQYWGWRDSLDWVHHVTWVPGHALTFGVDHSADYFKALSVTEKNVGNTGLFIDDQYSITSDLFINAGIRSDRHQAFGRQTTWKVAPGYTVPLTGTRLKTTYGTGFKAPSLSQLFDASYGNPDLKPEKSKGWDFGFEQPLWHGKVTLGATFFRNDITNQISFDTSPPYHTINLGKARTQGVESSLVLKPVTGLTITGTHTFTQADDRLADKQLSRRPKHQANLSSAYQYSVEGDVGMNVRYVGSSSDINFDTPFNRVFNKSFATVDLVTNYKVTPNVTLYGRAENILDKRYEEVYGYGQMGAALYAGVKANY